MGARFCCRRISTVNEGRTRFKESPQCSRKTDRESSNRREEIGVSVNSFLIARKKSDWADVGVSATHRTRATAAVS